MSFQKFEDDEKQFLHVGIYTMKNKDGSHNAKITKDVLDILWRLPLPLGSSSSDSSSFNYIATSLICKEKDAVMYFDKLKSQLDNVEKIEKGDHISLNQLHEICDEIHHKLREEKK